MLNYRDAGIVEYIYKCCKDIIADINGKSFNDFINDHILINSCAFLIMQIGEEAKHLSPEFIEERKKIPWQKIKRMRDKVAHGYHKLNLNTVYRTATLDIPELYSYCIQIISEMPEADEIMQ